MKKMYLRRLTVFLAAVLCITLFSGAGWKEKSGVKNQMAKNFLEILESELTDGVYSVTFVNRKNAKGTDISALGDGSVVAWMKDHPGTKAKDLYIAANGKVIAPQNCSGLFEGLATAREINFNNCFDTSRVTDMSRMFAYCLSLQELDLSSFQTKKVTNMGGMFVKCMGLEAVDVSSFDTAAVTDMSLMFYQCTNLKELDVRNFRTEKVRTMESMFEACQVLKSLDLRNFHTGKGVDYGFMFRRCNSLEYLDIRNFDFSDSISEGLQGLYSCLFCGEVYAGINIVWPEQIDSELFPYNTVLFGHYEQDGERSAYSEMIEWLVLDVQDGKALLLSADALDAVPFHKSYTAVTWENCTLRNWLNDTFLDTAFDEEEQALIFTTKVDNSASQGNKKWKNADNKTTSDKVFLLSYEEAVRYFGTDQLRVCTPTKYAVSRGADVRKVDQDTEAGWWWLRSPGEKSHHAAFVNFDGKMYSNAVANDYLAVRPAMWIDLDAYYAYIG